MSDLLLAVLERVPSRVRRGVVAAGALLALAAVMAALTLTAPHGDGRRQPVRERTESVPVQRSSRPRLAPPFPATAIRRARRVAQRFLAGYLPFAYGRADLAAVNGITPTLRSLLLGRAQLTPAERRRRPRVVSLQTTATTPTFVVATAVIDDGGVTTYHLRFTLEGRAGRWLVSGVQEG